MRDGLVIDMFAGGGGASQGIRDALGREVDIAVNHDLKALMMHAVNHPGALHLEEDVFNVRLAEYTRGRHVSLMWASPDCTHFSRARGAKPRSQHIRMLPWAVYEQSRAILPDVVVCENVAEIQTWEDYGAFVAAMRSLGYTFECRELCAADFGARTSRTRWYAVLRRDGCATAWPLPNHKRPDTLLDPHLPHWLSVRPCIDLADVGKRVDHRSRPLSAKTLARMERGFREYGGQWLMSYYGTGVGQSLDMPLRTITCTDRFALVTMRQRHAHLRMLRPEELKLAQGFPVRYVIDRYSDGTAVPKREQVRRIGNSVVPTMAMQLVRANARAA
ncbi:MAG: DNA cytosine methyltransferase [Atopobiaceae bacterium]|nr:DNA cytosine methyltransferase [Atopobiaceae bacterium]